MGKGLKDVLVMLGLLMEFAFTMLAAAVIGYILDQKFNTKPYLTVGFIVVGGLGSIKILSLIISRAKKKMEEKDG